MKEAAAVERERPEEPAVPLAGRRNELRSLSSALCARESRLVAGAAGIGKTRLVEEALRLSQQPFVKLGWPGALHELLLELVRRLDCSAGRPLKPTSVALKPVVLAALRSAPRCVVLEDASNADPRMYRFLQQVYFIPGVCLIVTAKSRDCLGHLRKLLWDPSEEIALQPLRRGEARAVFRAACAAFRLDSPEAEEFESKVLAAAQGNPGQIVTMCRLAGRPEYRAGRRIKFLPLRMDALAAFVG